MIFSIQRFIEDYLDSLGVDDRGQYAVALANLYDKYRSTSDPADFLKRMRRIRTTLFKKHPSLKRAEMEKRLLNRLDKKFQKKNADDRVEFPGGLLVEKRRLSKQRRSIRAILVSFVAAVEARAIDAFWDARTRGELRGKPESIAQALLAVFLKGTLGRDGYSVRELFSGIGYVDLAVFLTSRPHLIEVKILRGKFVGDQQLAQYMQSEERSRGWLLVLDARQLKFRVALPSKIKCSRGEIDVLVADINPTAPSKITAG